MDDDPSSDAWDATTSRAAEPAPPETPLSVDRHPAHRLLLPARAMRIGRTPDNDLILADLDVSRQHAELRKSPTGSYEIVDLGSHNGTFVNGKRVSHAMLTEHDIVNIGHSASQEMSCGSLSMTRKPAEYQQLPHHRVAIPRVQPFALPGAGGRS